MPKIFETIGFRFLHTTLRSAENRLSLSRRGFLFLTAALSSCKSTSTPAPIGLIPANKPSQKPSRTSAPSTSAPSTSAPISSGPVPKNPNIQSSSNFSISRSTTYTRALVSGKYIAMTFDDGPHPQNTPRLLGMLRERNIKATFFVIGNNVNSYPQVLRQTVAEGHEIGNHTQTHRLLSKLNNDQLLWELASCRDAVQQAAGYHMQVMRPPYGGLREAQRQLAYQEFNYPTILWSVDPLDWKRPGPSVVTSRILNNTNAGAIVLAHDLHTQTIDAMPATLDGLLRRGFIFVTVSQLLAMNQPSAATTPQAATANF